MKPTSTTIALTTTAALGTVGCFLPFLGGMTLSTLASAHGFMKPHLGMFLVPFIALLVLGVLSFAVFKRVARWQGIVGALFSVFAVTMLDGAVFHGTFKPAGFATMFTQGNIGAKLVVLGAIGALVTCLITAIKPDPKVVGSHSR